MSGTEQPEVQYETGESLFLGQRAKVMPYPFGLLRLHLGKGSRKWVGQGELLLLGRFESWPPPPAARRSC